jgi:hypothetical protein
MTLTPAKAMDREASGGSACAHQPSEQNYAVMPQVSSIFGFVYYL